MVDIDNFEQQEPHAEHLKSLLQFEKEQLEREHEQLVRDISDAKARNRVISDRLLHIHALLDQSDSRVALGGSADTTVHKDVTDIAAEILAERGREPLHYRALADEVKTRGGEISGSDPAAALVARLVRDERFVRPVSKGFYALRQDYPTAPNVGSRKKRRRAA